MQKSTRLPKFKIFFDPKLILILYSFDFVFLILFFFYFQKIQILFAKCLRFFRQNRHILINFIHFFKISNLFKKISSIIFVNLNFQFCASANGVICMEWDPLQTDGKTVMACLTPRGVGEFLKNIKFASKLSKTSLARRICWDIFAF